VEILVLMMTQGAHVVAEMSQLERKLVALVRLVSMPGKENAMSPLERNMLQTLGPVYVQISQYVVMIRMELEKKEWLEPVVLLAG
jgi:hypothetical protein